MPDDTSIDKVLDYYMGKNTQERQDFIIDNLRFEVDVIEENASSSALTEA
jgi:topoisomerase-4 subunit B